MDVGGHSGPFFSGGHLFDGPGLFVQLVHKILKGPVLLDLLFE
jgi:hypothetical protein